MASEEIRMSRRAVTEDTIANGYVSRRWTAAVEPIVDHPDWDSALDEWSKLLHPEHLIPSGPPLTDYARSTLPTRTTPSAVVQPTTVEQVQGVVRIAHRHGIPWHTISKGKNWGYGDACAPQDGQLIIDLSRLNAIREINQDLAYAVIESGVSQGQLYDHLREQKIPLMMDVTGAGPDASIIGNILQRGFGHTPYAQRIEHCARFEVVLPDGQLLYTGADDNNPNIDSAHVYRWGLGPSVEGLFSQSNLGIVTALTLWLMPQPSHVEAYAVELADDEALCRGIEVLRDMKLNGLISSAVHIANKQRIQQHTSRATQNNRNKPAAQWNVGGGIYGDRSTIRPIKKILKTKFRRVGRLFFFNRKTLKLADHISPALRQFASGRDLLAKISAVQTVYDLMCGEPIGRHLEEFLKQHESSEREAGLIWVSPVFAATSEALMEGLRVIRGSFEKYQFLPQITLTLVNPRAIVAVTSITFDKQDQDETSRATECANDLKAQLAAHGITCYRKATIDY